MPDGPSQNARATLTIKWTDYASKNLNARIRELRRRDQWIPMDDRVSGIQFLRGVSSRASQILPAFYLFLGSSIKRDPGPDTPPWKPMEDAVFNTLALQNITLTCRAIFDESTKRELSAKRFANLDDKTLSGIAVHCVEMSKHSSEEAMKALTLLRDLFRLCAKPKKLLLGGDTLLERRVGLLKYYADRVPAHITLEAYLVDTIDIAHVVAAIAVVGAIAYDFDPVRPDRVNPKYFDALDECGWAAARTIFPELTMERLFARATIAGQARRCWAHPEVPEYGGLTVLTTLLPDAIGCWDSRDDTAVPAESGT